MINGLALDYPPLSLVRDPRTEGLTNMTPLDPVLYAAVADGRDTGELHRMRASHADQSQSSTDPSIDMFDRTAVDMRNAAIATEHYANMPPMKESDLIVSFLYRCRTKGGYLLTDSVLNIV